MLSRFLALVAVNLWALSSVAGAEPVPRSLLAALSQSERFELFALLPERSEKSVTAGFHGWPILAQSLVADRETQNILTQALKAGAESSFSFRSCFEPRHGVRLLFQGKTVDLVICFKCETVEVYLDDRRVKGFSTTNSPEATFDRVVADRWVSGRTMITPRPTIEAVKDGRRE
jgi:hypothetical protein